MNDVQSIANLAQQLQQQSPEEDDNANGGLKRKAEDGGGGPQQRARRNRYVSIAWYIATSHYCSMGLTNWFFL